MSAHDVPPPRPGSLPYAPVTDEEKGLYLTSPMLAASRIAGLTESQVVTLLARENARLRTDLARVLETSPTPLRFVVPA